MSKYKKVYADIKDKIEQNIWKAQDELPTENELMETYSYSKDSLWAFLCSRLGCVVAQFT